MTSLQYQYVVPPSFDLSFNLRLFIVENLASFRKYISWAHFETGLVKRLTKKLNKDLILMIVSLKGMEAIVKDIPKEQALDLYPVLEKQLSRYNVFFAKLYKDNFFNNNELELVANDLLSEFYDIDLIVKQNALSDSKTTQSDKELINIAIQFSSLTLSKFDGCKV